WMLADMHMKLEAARLLLYRAAAHADLGTVSPIETSMAKVFTVEAGKQVADDAMQIFGGYGYMADAPVQQLYRMIRGGSIAGGTTQIHRNTIASQLLGRRFSQWKQ